MKHREHLLQRLQQETSFTNPLTLAFFSTLIRTGALFSIPKEHYSPTLSSREKKARWHTELMTLLRYGTSDISLQQLAEETGVTKQAVDLRLKKTIRSLKNSLPPEERATYAHERISLERDRALTRAKHLLRSIEETVSGLDSFEEALQELDWTKDDLYKVEAALARQKLHLPDIFYPQQRKRGKNRHLEAILQATSYEETVALINAIEYDTYVSLRFRGGNKVLVPFNSILPGCGYSAAHANSTAQALEQAGVPVGMVAKSYETNSEKQHRYFFIPSTYLSQAQQVLQTLMESGEFELRSLKIFGPTPEVRPHTSDIFNDKEQFLSLSRLLSKLGHTIGRNAALSFADFHLQNSPVPIYVHLADGKPDIYRYHKNDEEKVMQFLQEEIARILGPDRPNLR